MSVFADDNQFYDYYADEKIYPRQSHVNREYFFEKIRKIVILAVVAVSAIVLISCFTVYEQLQQAMQPTVKHEQPAVKQLPKNVCGYSRTVSGTVVVLTPTTTQTFDLQGNQYSRTSCGY